MPEVNYFWDEIEDNVVREYDENNDTIANYTTEPVLHGNVISQKRSGETHFYHFDGQGNTTELTDENGNVTDSRRYSAFGEVTHSTGATTTPFAYKGVLGYYVNSPSNDLDTRKRTYSPQIGRWLSCAILASGEGYSMDPQEQGKPPKPPQQRKPGWFRCTKGQNQYGRYPVKQECDGCDVNLVLRVLAQRCFRYDPATGKQVLPEDDPENFYTEVQVRTTGTVSCECQAESRIDRYDTFTMSYGCFIMDDLTNLLLTFWRNLKDPCKFVEELRAALQSMPPCR